MTIHNYYQAIPTKEPIGQLSPDSLDSTKRRLHAQFSVNEQIKITA